MGRQGVQRGQEETTAQYSRRMADPPGLLSEGLRSNLEEIKPDHSLIIYDDFSSSYPGVEWPVSTGNYFNSFHQLSRVGEK